MSTSETLPFSRDIAALDARDWYEVIDGQRVEMPPMSADSTGIAADLSLALGVYGTATNTGKSYTEMLIRLPLPVDRNRRPDVIFVPFSRWPKNQALPSTNEWDVLPSLCVEVVSPNDLADEVMTKVGEYLQAGVPLVWVVYPRHGYVQVYESLTQARGLTRGDTLEGGTALPGFSLKLSELFPESPPSKPTP